MEPVETTAATVGALAVFSAVGWGVLALVRAELELDVRVALAPAIGAAAFFTLSAALLPAAPFDVLLACVAVLAANGVRTVRNAGCLPRPGVWWRPAVFVSCVAAAVALVPTLAHGNGTPSTYGNIDPYLWVSQARAFLDGPIEGPSSVFPDRVAYEHLVEGHWAPGVPALIAFLARLFRTDPVDAFGASSALVYVLTPLMTYVVARAALGWSRRLGAGAAVLVALGGYGAFASYFGWEPQLIGTALGLGIALTLWLSLREGSRSFPFAVLASMFVSGSLGAYRQPFFPYVLLLVSLVTLTASLGYRTSPMRGVFARRVIRFSALACTFSLPSLLAIVKGADRFWSRQSGILDWERFARGLPSEAIGLSPRLSDLAIVPSGLRIAGLVVAIPVLLHGTRSLVAARDSGSALVLVLAGMTVVANALFQLPAVSPYMSLKVVAYGAPALVLVAIAPLRGRRLPTPALTIAGQLGLVTTAAVLVSGVNTQNAQPLERVVDLADRLPHGSAVSIDITSPWDQMWSIYYLRDRPLEVLHPTTFLTGLGFRRPDTYYRKASASYVLVERPRRHAIECWGVSRALSEASRAVAGDDNLVAMTSARRSRCGLVHT